jgi:uncharacterized membrane protein YccC
MVSSPGAPPAADGTVLMIVGTLAAIAIGVVFYFVFQHTSAGGTVG